MNSIVQEASSIAKAVEQAWEKAGKPQKFSVRIFEEAQKNFFGITNKPAKIALLFELQDLPRDPEKKAPRQQQQRRPQQTQKRQERPERKPAQQKTEPRRPEKRKTEARKLEPKKPAAPQQPQPQTQPQQQPQPQPQSHPQTQPEKNLEAQAQKKPRELWTDEMVAIARNWMKDMLDKQGKSNISFTTEVKRYHLKFLLNEPVDQDEAKEKNLFRNSAYLIMQSIRNRLKKQLRYHKVVITSTRQ